MPAPRYRLWIDGVGCWNLSFGQRWCIGGPGSQADLEMLAPLDEQAATVAIDEQRAEVQYPSGSRRLQRTDAIDCERGVSLSFGQPHPWTPAATIQPTSSHRPVDQADGWILGAGPCVLGPESDCHVVCSAWSHGIVVFERAKAIYWKRLDGPCDTNPVNRLGSDSLIETDEARVSVETLSTKS